MRVFQKYGENILSSCYMARCSFFAKKLAMTLEFFNFRSKRFFRFDACFLFGLKWYKMVYIWVFELNIPCICPYLSIR